MQKNRFFVFLILDIVHKYIRVASGVAKRLKT